MPYRSIEGNRYGKLVAIKDLGISKDKHHRKWLMQCDCGNQCERITSDLKSRSSCGCMAKEHLKAMSRSNITHGMTGTGLLNSYKAMKSRCCRKTDIHYPAYGGRGISICEEWKKDSKAFVEWAISNGWKEGLTIERRDVNGNYCPENCCWIPKEEQYKNKRLPYQMRRKLSSPPKEDE